MLQPVFFQGSRSCKRTTNLGNSFWVIVKYEQSINLSLPRCLIRHKEWYLCGSAGSEAMIFSEAMILMFLPTNTHHQSWRTQRCPPWQIHIKNGTSNWIPIHEGGGNRFGGVPFTKGVGLSWPHSQWGTGCRKDSRNIPRSHPTLTRAIEWTHQRLKKRVTDSTIKNCGEGFEICTAKSSRRQCSHQSPRYGFASKWARWEKARPGSRSSHTSHPGSYDSTQELLWWRATTISFGLRLIFRQIGTERHASFG